MNKSDRSATLVPAVGAQVQRGVRRSARWRHAATELPPTNIAFGDSDYLLCQSTNTATPFVGWYNSKSKTWHVAHHYATQQAVDVIRWRDLPACPDVVYA